CPKTSIGIALGPHDRGHAAPLRRSGCIGLYVLAHDLAWRLGSHARRGPTAWGRAEAAATALRLRPGEGWGLIIGRAGVNSGFDGWRTGFFKASWVWAVAAGCVGRGTIFRQPWRFTRRAMVVWCPRCGTWASTAVGMALMVAISPGAARGNNG